MARGAVRLIPTAKAKTSPHVFSGPVKFKAPCANCGEPRNRHCGHCKGCPGWHVAACMIGNQTGYWH